jgi:predicted aspartyl protease
MVRMLRLKKIRSAKAHLANGSTVTIDIARLASLSVGPLQVNQVQVALVEREKGIRIGDGLLGMNVLKHRPHRIDYQQKCIIWEARD